MDKPKVKCLGVNPKFLEFLNSTEKISDAMNLMFEWSRKNVKNRVTICTNNKHEEELEREWLEDRKKLYASRNLPEKKEK